MKTILHKAETRGHQDHGWLEANHSFSFANYYHPERMHFGVIRVLNDDVIAPGKGFGMHPHDNMEIISIPLEGALQHKDNMGNEATIKQGDIQVMSAGTGVFHSEFNAKQDTSVKLLQIWLYPNQKDVQPRYGQLTINQELMQNKFAQILSPNLDDEGVWIYQNAWFHLGHFSARKDISYQLKNPKNGVYAFILEGEVTIENQKLSKRDALGLWETPQIQISTGSHSKILLLEVPMTH